MTMTEFYVKLKTKDENLELRSSISASLSLKELKQKIAEVTSIPASSLKIFFGYPRKLLNCLPSESIDKCGIRNGDTLFIEEEERKESISKKENDPVPQPVAGGSSTSNSVTHITDDNERVGVKGILLKKTVPSDNSCLFTSLEFVLSGKMNTSASSHMRQLVANIIASQPEEYNDAILGKPVKEYCEWILDPSSWGGAIEIAILSNHFGFEIAVVNSTTGIICRFGEDKNYSQRVFLLFDGIHYDPLYMDFATIDKIETIFPTSDETVLHDAQQLALEANQSKQYTDVNQFMVCCTICNALLVGQQEAQTHAKETGHSSFDEVVGS